MKKQVDLVTVCFADELKMLQLQARSVRLYMDKTILGTIHIIINDSRDAAVRKFIETDIFPNTAVSRKK